MVLKDISSEYNKLRKVISSGDVSYISAVEDFINMYQTSVDTIINSYISFKETEKLKKDLDYLEINFLPKITNMINQARYSQVLINEIKKCEFKSELVNLLAEDICKKMEVSLDCLQTYMYNRMLNITSTQAFLNLYNSLLNLNRELDKLFISKNILSKAEEELLEKLPEVKENEKVTYIDIRSYKESTNIEDFAEDIKNISDCLYRLENILLPQENGNAIFYRKIESGTINISLGSVKIDLSVVSDIINCIINAIRNIRLLPSEIEKKELENKLLEKEIDARNIDNEYKKISIINNDIEFYLEKLKLEDNPVVKESLQNMLIPLIKYIENNPIGTINGITYDTTKRVELLEIKN